LWDGICAKIIATKVVSGLFPLFHTPSALLLYALIRLRLVAFSWLKLIGVVVNLSAMSVDFVVVGGVFVVVDRCCGVGWLLIVE
jgi:hypothetical protein